MNTPDWLEFMSSSFETSSPFELDEKPVAEKTQVSLPSISTETSIETSKTVLLTPPASAHGSPIDETNEPTIVSVSTTFYPSANLFPGPPDLIFLSSDAVFFYTHAHRIVNATTNRFNSLLPDDLLSDTSGSNPPSPVDSDKDEVGPIIPVPESSHILNIVLHAIYCMSSVLYHPSLAVLTAGVAAMEKYGIPLQKYISPSTPLYQHLLAQSPSSPVEVYTCAARHGLQELAVQASPHLLTFPLCNISDEDALQMGPVYLKKMFFQHLGRVDALKRLLLPPPENHPPTTECGFFEQKKLTRAWALASAYLAWDARPDLSTGAIESALGPLAEHLECEVCKKALRERVKTLIVQWALVKRTI
ncbi:hypothetical protein BDY19DRAFT_127055 [Irpex rosettiformis]|uniref:Uncharacterized protein n=1 Tax=Irpex rosettiformis TaxID=378272 RepID=A0ACB8U4I2_9APHY|nr:hypothetical protein BDY19DRAFT_127055 [Irpex rosettiformis]